MKSVSAKKPARKAAPAVNASASAAHRHDDACGHDHSRCDHDHGSGGGVEIGIRLYRPEDYRALKAMWKAGDIAVDDTDNAKALKENSEKRKHSFRIFVAEAQPLDASGKAAGEPLLAAAVICAFDGRRVYLYHFTVHPDFRGLGLGTALLETCEHQARLWGARHLRLMSRTDPTRASARGLYEKLGWSAQKELCQYSKMLKV